MSLLALVIDPSRLFRHLVTRRLAEHEVAALEASSAAEALATLARQRVDVVCMAMNLPDSDGADLCLRLRALGGGSRIPILLLTSSESREATRRCLAAGITELFRKQDLEDFSRYLAQFVESARRQRSMRGYILFLEDSRAIALRVTRALEEAGYGVDHFGSAEEGIEAFSRGDYDLVLTDILLEGSLTGTAMLRAVREHPDPLRRTTPVVAMSAHNEPSRRVQLFASGVSDYVSKPVLDEELVARVSNLIENRRLLARLAQSYERIEQLALVDQLTGLHNRHYLAAEVPRLLAQLRGAGQAASIVVTDIDHFKRVNDTHGHERGDQVLQAVGQLLRDSAKVVDGCIAARLGGEEFLLLLPAHPLASAGMFAEQLRLALRALRPAGLELSASFGVAELAEGENYESLFRRADAAAYAAKQAGRDRVVQANLPPAP